MLKVRSLIFVIALMFSSFSFITNHTVEAAPATIVNPNQVYSYDKMVSDIKNLQKAYPDLIKFKVVGKSEYGRNIYAVSLGKGNATAFINGSHHAREWLTTNLNMDMIEEYAKAYKNNSNIQGYPARSILNSTTIWFIPMVNPDGVTLQQQGLKAFPKSAHLSLIKMNNGSLNFKRWKANGKGVDLNRQYNAGWATIRNSPQSPSYKNYKGAAPASASEVKAVLKLVSEIDPEIAVAYHSSGQILYWNYKQNAANYKRDHVYAKAIGKMTGYRLVYPGPNPSGGGFTDWFIQSKKRPGFTPEISRYVFETNPPLSEYKGAWRENQAVGLYVARESAKLYDAKIKKEADKIASSTLALKKKASKLRLTYYSNVKKEANLTLKKSFTDLYASVVKESKDLEKKANKVPKKHRKKIDSHLKSINKYKKYAKAYIDGVNAGNKVVSLTKNLDNRLTSGKMNKTTITRHKNLQSSIAETEATIKKMYGKKARSLARKKYTTPASILTKNANHEIERYNLTLQIEKDIKNKKLEQSKAKLTELTKLEKVSASAKKTGNKKYPGKYKTYNLIETLLKDRRTKAETTLEQLEKELEEPEEEAPIEEPAEEETVVPDPTEEQIDSQHSAENLSINETRKEKDALDDSSADDGIVNDTDIDDEASGQ